MSDEKQPRLKVDESWILGDMGQKLLLAQVVDPVFEEIPVDGGATRRRLVLATGERCTLIHALEVYVSGSLDPQTGRLQVAIGAMPYAAMAFARTLDVILLGITRMGDLEEGDRQQFVTLLGQAEEMRTNIRLKRARIVPG